ncbi:hypothetical protein AB0C27_53875 [Nonomuraea sp. NPDC048882]|uniref:hypothetical protein n=1 Tax=Nonomuraea sp. NPDC048882 TaxID=3154347 RepID=UPI0033CBB746
MSQDASPFLVPVIPDGHVLAPSKIVWLECDAYVVGTSWHRRDWMRNYQRVGEALVRNTEPWMQTRHGMTWKSLAGDAGVSRSTLADRLQWRREHGLIAVVQTGSTVETREGTGWGRWDDGLGNIAAEYALICPVAVLEALYGEFWAEELGVEDGSCYVERPRRGTQASIVANPAWEEVPWPCETRISRPKFPQVEQGVNQTRTLRFSLADLSSEPVPIARRLIQTLAPFPLTACPSTRGERIWAGERVRAEHVTVRGLSARDLGRIGRPLFQLGATLGDFIHVLNVHPVQGQWASPATGLGERRSWSALVRLRRRLEARVAAWIGPDGALVAPLPSQAAARAHQEARADTGGGWRERLEQAVAQPDPPKPQQVAAACTPSMPPQARAGLRERLAAARASWTAARESRVPGALLRARRRAALERGE